MKKGLKKIRRTSRGFSVELVEKSPLRRIDPRTKLFLSLSASLAVMLPFYKLLAFFAVYIIFIIWARLLIPAALQLWRLKWLLIILFIFDWIFISLDLAMIITLRLSLLTIAFAMFFSTTTPREFCLALEWMKVPYRYAFSISLAFSSVGAISSEWRSIIEAQKSRGVLVINSSIRQIIHTLHNLISLTVPSIVLTTRRAWSMTEAAYARGFDSPNRKSYHTLHMGLIDWLLLSLALALLILIIFWRQP